MSEAKKKAPGRIFIAAQAAAYGNIKGCPENESGGSFEYVHADIVAQLADAAIDVHKMLRAIAIANPTSPAYGEILTICTKAATALRVLGDAVL